MLKKVFLITIMASSVFAQEDLSIEIDISKQRLFLLENSVITSSYPISSSKYGEGKQAKFIQNTIRPTCY
jgi:hypothetical protein